MWFHCAVFRREDRKTRDRSAHVISLTGRKRVMSIGNAGNRNSKHSREYKCSCGHVGWSRHVDLEVVEATKAYHDS